MADEAQPFTLAGQIEDILKHPRVLATGYYARQTQMQDKDALATLYFAVYPRDIVADLHAASSEMDQTFAGEYGHFNLEVSPTITYNRSLVGAVMIVDAAPWSDTPSGPFIIEVIVHPEHRRKGLAEYAVQWAARALRVRGEHSVALRVMSDNASACALYHKLGFRWTA